MIYLEILQKLVRASASSFSGKTLTYVSSVIPDISPGDKILIKGSLNGSNDDLRIVDSATSSEIVFLGEDFTTQSFTQIIEIYKIEFFSDPATFHDDERGVTRFYNPGILSIGEISRTADGAFVRLNDGTITLNRQYLLGKNVFDSPDGLTAFDLQDKTKLFTFTIRLSYDDTKLFDGVIGIIRQIDEMGVTFQLKTELSDADFLRASADVNETTIFTQGRVLPFVNGLVYHFKPLLQNDSLSAYYSGGTYLYSAYDDGVVVPVQNVTTTYSIGDQVKYNDLAYSAAINNPTVSPTGAATNNTGWNYVAPATTQSQFKCTAFNFRLVSAPVGSVTIDIEGDTASLSSLGRVLGRLVKVPNNDYYADTITLDSASKKVFDSNNGLGIFRGGETDIIGQYVKISGGLNNGFFTIVSVAEDGSEMTLQNSPVTDTSGSRIKIEGYFGISYEFSDITTNINYAFDTQIKAIEALKQVTDFAEHFFFFDREEKLMYLIDKEKFSQEIPLTAFDIDLDSGVQFLTKEVVFSFKSDWIQRLPVINPSRLLEINRRTEQLTGIETGETRSFTQFDNNNSGLLVALAKKRDVYLNYDRIEIKYTIDGPGIDTRLKPGVKINFDAWISGELYVQEVIWNIEQGQNIVRGIANNIVFKDVE